MKKQKIKCDTRGMFIYSNSEIIALKYYDIIAIVTDMPYTVVLAKGHKKGIYIESGLSNIIEELPSVFFLCNQSAIVNLYYLQVYEEKYEQYTLHLNTGLTFKVSRRKKQAFKERLLYLKENCSLSCEQLHSCSKICMVKK